MADICAIAPNCIIGGGVILFLVILWWYQGGGRLVSILRKSRDSFQNLVDVLPYGIALTNLDGEIISANRALAHLLGYDIRQLKGASFPELIKLDSSDIISRASTLSPGEVLRLPTVLTINRNGKLCHLRPCIFRDKSKKDVLFWHVQDQTNYLELEKRFDELIESVPVGLFWADLNGKIGATNPEFDNFFCGDQIPATLDELLGENAWKEASKSLIVHGDIFKTRIIKAEIGQNRYLELEIKKIVHGASRYFAGILKDVTVEYELQQKLREAFNEADAANRAKSLFLSQMSHEFRTPLNVIQGMANLLEDKVTEPNTLELVSDLKKAAEHLSSLIGEILDLAKIESGKLSLEPRPFDLKKLLVDLDDVLGIQARLKDLEFEVIFPEDLHRFYVGDPVRIKQIIFNIAGNGIKFTKRGRVEVAVSALEGPDSSRRKRLRFRISDTGPGMPKNILPRLFEPFVQAKEGRKIGGTGLGLFIAKELIEMMDGNIRVESTEGKGSVFTVELELEVSEAPVSSHTSYQEPCHLDPGLALVADDVPMNRKVLRMYLEKHGWQVKEATNGKEALDILEKSPEKFHVVLMDISMPEMDGITATKALRQNKEWADLPVIAVTAHAMAEDRKKFLEAGMDGYVPKPVKPEILWQEIERLVLKKSRRDQAEFQETPETNRPHQTKKHLEGSQNENELETGPTPPIDYPALVKTCQGMEELAKELLSATLEESPKWLEQAKRAVASCDAQEIRKICHLIRGSAATVQAGPLHEAAARLGKAAREERSEDYDKLLSALTEATTDLNRWIEEELSGMNGIDGSEKVVENASKTESALLV
ncbi:MAG: response regulator [Thermodesulfobacteria bacterium]|nr:response regulator [Thermodesulfobacteriota bacterium]